MDNPEEIESIEILEEETSDIDDDYRVIRGKSSRYRKEFEGFYADKQIPVIFLDEKLRILWENKEYKQKIGRGRKNEGNYFTNICYTFRDQNNIEKLFKALKNTKKNYSWKGRTEFREKMHLNIISNCVILPVAEKSKKPPYYFAIFDDITKENKALVRGTFLSLLEASKLKDNDTGKHIHRVGKYSVLISEYLFENEIYTEITKEFIDNIGFLAPMHDVGKIGTPDDILNKAGALESWEWKIMKEHTLNGAYILSTYPDPMAKQIALFHHEKWNGEGYPYQLSEYDIPVSARIVSIADVYDALRMKRSYKRSYSHEDTCRQMNAASKIHFDPDLIRVFNILEKEFERIYLELSD